MTFLVFNHFFVSSSSFMAHVFSAHLSGSGALVHGAAYLSTLLCLIIVIAFFTVLERKLLASIQRRAGPNMSSLWGLLQAFADAVKLLLKEPLVVSGANFYIFVYAPVILLTLSLTIWIFIPIPNTVFNVASNYSFLIVFLFSGLNSYAIVLSGLSSNSRYSLMGGVRAIAQVISYEIPMSVCLVTLAALQNSYNLFNFYTSNVLFAFLAYPTVAVFFVCLLAETNRTPFDLPEAEAELVAGYNLEYSAIMFSLFFLAEYSNMIVAASLMSLLVCSSHFFFGVIMFCIWMIIVRSALPRYTFRQLISLSWKTLFPLSLFWFTLTIVVLFFLDAFYSATVDPVLFNVSSDIADSVYLVGDSSLKITSGMAFVKAFIFFFVALGLSSLLVGFNWIIITRKFNNRKNSPYECGFEPLGSPVANFEPNFIGVGIAFLIYDVEILLTYPWAIGLKGQPFAALFVFLLFIVFLILSYAYEVKEGSFDL